MVWRKVTRIGDFHSRVVDGNLDATMGVVEIWQAADAAPMSQGARRLPTRFPNGAQACRVLQTSKNNIPLAQYGSGGAGSALALFNSCIKYCCSSSVILFRCGNYPPIDIYSHISNPMSAARYQTKLKPPFGIGPYNA